MKLIVKYWNSIYIYVLLLVTSACFCAGLFFTFFKWQGNYPELSWIQLFSFDFSHLIYIGIALYFILKNRKDCTYIPTHLRSLKVYLITMLVIQYIFILALFPSTYIWTLTYLFILCLIFFFDSRITAGMIILLTVCLLLFILQDPQAFLPLEKSNWREIVAFETIEYCFTCVFIFFTSIFVEKLLFNEHFAEEENIHLLERQLEYYRHTDLMDKELRKFRHDIKNHFLSMEELLAHEDYPQLIQYFEELKQSFSFQEKIYFSNNVVIDSIMNYELATNCSEHVKIQVIGTLPELTTVSPMDLCTLFSNLLSNAVAAVNRYSLKAEGALTIEFQTGSKYFSIAISNHTVQRRLAPAKFPFSITDSNSAYQKPDALEHLSNYPDRNHGYGIGKIQEIVKKYNGTLEHSLENNIMTIRIYLPI